MPRPSFRLVFSGVRSVLLRPALPGLLALGILGALAMSGCNSTQWPERDPAVIEDADADSLVFWPPRAHALAGDFLNVEVRGLKRVYACARILSMEWNPDSLDPATLQLHARVELPPDPACAQIPTLDTMLELTAPASGALRLRRPDGVITDSLRVIAGTGVVEGFLHVRPAHDSLNGPKVLGRYRFRDSTAAHPRRSLAADALAACEVIQAAVFERRNGGDTLSLRVRTLLATPALPAAGFPACAGPHYDSVEVVRDKYEWP